MLNENENLGIEEMERIEKEIKRLNDLLQTLDPEGESYGRVANNLKILVELKTLKKKEKAFDERLAKEKEFEKEKSAIDKNMIIQDLCLILTMGMCMHAEHIGSITTKAFAFLPRFIGNRRV